MGLQSLGSRLGRSSGMLASISIGSEGRKSRSVKVPMLNDRITTCFKSAQCILYCCRAYECESKQNAKLNNILTSHGWIAATFESYVQTIRTVRSFMNETSSG